MSPLAKNLSELPKAAPQSAGGGLAPDAEARFVHVLAQQWQARNDAEGDRPNAVVDTRFRFSDAAKCARAVAYKAAGIARTNPMDLCGVWNTSLGTVVHDHWQEALRAAYPDAEIEVKVSIEGLDGSGHGDATVRTDERTVCVELKTVGGWKFKNAIGKAAKSRPAEGPDTSHMVQVALAGKAQNADEVVVAYLAKETLSHAAGAGMTDWSRFCAEWTFTREQYEPIADAEIARVNGILALLDDDGLLAARKVPFEMPPSAEIVDPALSRWEQRGAEGELLDTGSVWNGQLCLYCGWFDLCVKTPSGRVPVEQVVEISRKAVA